MDIRSRKTRKVVEYLEKREKNDLAIRAAIARSNARLDASQNALRVVEPATLRPLPTAPGRVISSRGRP